MCQHKFPEPPSPQQNVPAEASRRNGQITVAVHFVIVMLTTPTTAQSAERIDTVVAPLMFHRVGT